MTALILLSKFCETEIELWRPVVGFPGYDVSSLGRIRTYWIHLKGKRVGRHWTIGTLPIIKRQSSSLATNGYAKIELRRDGKAFHLRVHRLVAKAFVVNPQNYIEVGHKNAVRNDCRAANLEWTTRQDNVARSHLYSNLKSHKIDADGVRAIRAIPKSPGIVRVLSERYGVSQSTISEIRTGKRRWYIEDEKNG